ncbi:hypothetical protein ACL03H_03360 [Saccharopolyspora sp. MS10]|uniref:hypothetical protein n=1 Tax=Saccharopolyspora sp. MS10 TaxID=3385973 RepID=UPI0039A10474
MSQPGPPEQGPHRPDEPAGALDQTAQQTLIQDLGRALLRSMPLSWREVTVEYRAVGEHSELSAQLLAPNGTTIPLAVAADVPELFARLRHGMYQVDRGTWTSALYRLQRPSSYSVDFDGDHEPVWRTPPPAAALAAELSAYPRTEANIPGWLEGDTSAPATELRTAEVFDAVDEHGRPHVERPALADEEAVAVADYLDAAPVVLAARSYDADQLDPAAPSAVPLTFHTDGRWIWPGAVSYYLRAHGVPPVGELVEHIRRSGFRVPEVDERARELAVSVITGEERR